MDYKRTQYKARSVKDPNKGHPGSTNPNFKHGGYVIDLLTDAEADRYEKDMAAYKKACPYLFEDPFLANMVHDYQMMKLK